MKKYRFDNTVLMGSSLREAIHRLSLKRGVFETTTLIQYGKKVNRKVKNYTVNKVKVVIGAGGKRKEALKSLGIPGHKVAMWCMDSPITRYWQPRVKKLGKLLGVDDGEVFDNYGGQSKC